MLHSLCQQIRKTQQWPQGWKRSILILIPKKGNTKKCANHWTIALFSHARKVMLKILHARFQHYVSQEIPGVQAWFRKERETQRSNCQHSLNHRESNRIPEFQKNIFLCFTDQAKASDCVEHKKLWNALKEMGIPEHLTCLLRNLYVVKKQQLELDMNSRVVQNWERSVSWLCIVILFI